MDVQVMRDRAKEHADAVARGDVDAVVADFTEALQPQFPQLAQALPQPVTAAEVLSVEVGDTESVALIRYTGDAAEVVVRARWQEQRGRPVIVHAEPAD
jgi:hypothetical protein